MNNLELAVQATRELSRDALNFALRTTEASAIIAVSSHCIPTGLRTVFKLQKNDDYSMNDWFEPERDLPYSIGIIAGGLSWFPQMQIYFENPKYFAIPLLTNIGSVIYERARKIKGRR